jgi:hypothetical protein
MHVAFKISYMYDWITKVYKTKAEGNLNNVNPNIRGNEQKWAMHRKYKRLKRDGGQAYDSSADELQYHCSNVK